MKKELPACPVETTLMLISNRWNVLILRDLMEGTKRFGELKKSLGNISQKVLTANLRAMEENGLLIRTVYAQVPPKVEYTLTDTGYSLKPVLDAMVQWGIKYQLQLMIKQSQQAGTFCGFCNEEHCAHKWIKYCTRKIHKQIINLSKIFLKTVP